MIRLTIKTLQDLGLEMVDRIANRVGAGSIALTVTTTTASAAEKTQPITQAPIILEVTPADIALIISAIGGVLFIVEKVFLIYLRYQESKRIHDEAHKPTK